LITPEFKELNEYLSKNQRIQLEEMNVTFLECDPRFHPMT
jgi:hypothetical protein